LGKVAVLGSRDNGAQILQYFQALYQSIRIAVKKTSVKFTRVDEHIYTLICCHEVRVGSAPEVLSEKGSGFHIHSSSTFHRIFKSNGRRRICARMADAKANEAKRVEVVDDDEPDEWFVVSQPLFMETFFADLSS
jgi:hypothetical protein